MLADAPFMDDTGWETTIAVAGSSFSSSFGEHVLQLHLVLCELDVDLGGFMQ
jgi:hypothetical protein